MTDDPRRQIPRTDTVLADPRLSEAHRMFGAEVVKQAVREAQQRARDGRIEPSDVLPAALAALPPAPALLRRVINATGVVLHTNLGRAPLSVAAIEAVTFAAGYVDIEYDVTTGVRAPRGRSALDALRAAVPDAGDVHVVNNGAAAIVLAATALAARREIVVARSEMVEIGDGFRLHELLASTGARLREVGATNRVHLRDYTDAVGPRTGFILKVHPSNFRIEGFTSAVGVAELARLPVPVVADIGSGLLRPEPLLPDEPDAATWLREGATVVTASGDKLLGGPQAGLLLGRQEAIEELRRHPLARALRVDKLTLAALEATLRRPVTPTASALHADEGELRERAGKLAARLAASGIAATVTPSAGVVGGGSAPGLRLPGWAVRLPPGLAEPLRHGVPCVVGRVHDGHFLLDLRCVPPAEDDAVAQVVERACS
ncbi:L-seryl-tRNA(Sec) selenium transferase [Salinispora arenicola]|uniref:L-seryl-tRNA(Sec) selenium transferase n=1 Tax=Salinispora arenicola TaxID=168697 RepID=A0A542XIF2_SALAC|nr:L-seryl-tRNA(Sec) selenium transferase [Salinispora arenicola]TQL35628.1 L-seryl-tRNA(Sec) selenium transferase [Salinispora arenicola]GIM88172.1 L-seryl-tRNA(Sec) selenium transferase [Salinispora arenicola]